MGATVDKIKGKAKQIEGKLTGDKIRTGQGKLEEAKGEVEGAVSRVADKIKTGARRARARVQGKLAETRSRARSRSRNDY